VKIVEKEKHAYSEHVITDSIREEIEARSQDADVIAFTHY
jgi:hypothetical protein